jgi:LPPG:FO 2-phospho-L-lactate transferase
MNVVALAGGVGGAKLAHGLAQILEPEQLTVIVNTGDDFEHLGLHISPDLDTVMYTLAGIANPDTGWGQVDETWNFFDAMGRLGAEMWFRLGDRDLATHVERTRRLRAGESLTNITATLGATLGIRPRVLPMSDDAVRTMVQTAEGELEFQEYFVHRRCEPAVTGFRFAGLGMAWPTPAVLNALDDAEAIIFCPSNPFVSLDPILNLRGVRERIKAKGAVAVSPLIGGQAVKGPAAKMFKELGLEVSAAAVARHYADLLMGFVLDAVDADLRPTITTDTLTVLVADTLMRSTADRARLAREVLDFATDNY